MKYRVALAVYEGPFHLLLRLIERDELDIYDIPISTITQQYLEYLGQMQEQDLVINGDFLVMAARLLQIKSRMLVPHQEVDDLTQEEDAEDPRQELVRKLVTYKFYKDTAEILGTRAQLRSKLYPRCLSKEAGSKEPIYTNPVGTATSKDLYALYTKALQALREAPQVQEIQKRISVRQRLQQLYAVLNHYRSQGVLEMRFSELLQDQCRREVLVTFLSVLELVRLQEVEAYQSGPFADIILRIGCTQEEEHR